MPFLTVPNSSVQFQIKSKINATILPFIVLLQTTVNFVSQVFRVLKQLSNPKKNWKYAKQYPHNIIFNTVFSGIGHKLSVKFKFATKNPLEVQHELLMSIVNTNKDTAFGKDHNFSEIDTIKKFQENVKVQNYNTLKPYIDRHLVGEADALLKGRPISYATTSGTTGEPKYIPVTQETKKASSE